MAKSNADYCKAYREKQESEAKRLGLTDVKVPLAKVTAKQMKSLAKQHQLQGVPDLLQTVFHNLANAVDPGAIAWLFAMPPIGFKLSPEAIKMQNEFNAMFLGIDPDDESEGE